ncbi:AMP phosphorylase, partial [Candidatus Woesearchaeota archaeon]|nr:AMP phosphorylase [Candidatus Woesearchaeota archaeon]
MMHLKVKDMDISTGGALVVYLNIKDAEKLDLHPSDRIKVFKGKKMETAIVDIAESAKAVPPGSIGLCEEVLGSINAKSGQAVKIMLAGKPLSIDFIKKKLDGFRLSKSEIEQIVWDIVHNKLTSVELTYFVAAGYSRHMTMKETADLTKAMASQGEQLALGRYPVMDKHSVGGVAGNRTTPVLVPIVAAAGLTIPKTSSRSITSPAGTADTMEVLTNVILTMDKMRKVVLKTNGCMVWGGALNLAPADDMIIKVERPLMIDAKSQLLASVMAKKASVSATHVLVDIPFGWGSKVESTQKAMILKRDFECIAKELKMKVKVLMTDGRQPIGNGIGPALEAKDLLYLLKNDERAPKDLRKKGLMLAGNLLEMGGKAKEGKGIKLASEILESGDAYRKMVEIIKMQGMKCIDPEKIEVGKYTYDYKSPKSGKVCHISSEALSKIARIAGAPADQGAGLYLYHHVCDKVKKGEKLFTIYAHNKEELGFAVKTLGKIDGFVI